MEPAKYLLTEEQRNTLLAYFYQRPYGEVAKGVDMLKNLPVAPTPVAEDGKPKE